MAFEQAAIPIQREQEFEALRSAIREMFAPPLAEKFFGVLKSQGVSVRNFEQVLAKDLIERAMGKRLRTRARLLYESLALSDKAQIRELYLQQLEQAPPELRKKFRSIYRDY